MGNLDFYLARIFKKLGFFLCFSTFITIVGCGQFLPEKLESRKLDKLEVQKITGILNLVDKSELNLNSLEKSSIFLFISESCESCKKETEELIRFLNTNGFPKNVNIYSVLLGSTYEDATDWLSYNKIPWSVGYDYDLELYNNYFKKLETPSILIYNLNTQKIFTHQGKVEIKDLAEQSGPWEFK